MSRHNLLFHEQFPIERCVRVTDRAKFSGQCTPRGYLVKRAVRRAEAWSINQAWGLGMSGMENGCESSLKTPSREKWLKMLISHNQKVRGQDRGCDLTPAWMLSLRRTDGSYPTLNLKVNLRTLSTPPLGESEPRGEPMGGQREDRRGSESWPVMGQIGPTRVGDTEPTREGGVLTSAWCGWTRELVRNLERVS